MAEGELEPPRVLTPENAEATAAARQIRTFAGVQASFPQDYSPGMTMALVSPGGVGKTTLIGTLLESELAIPVLYLDARGNGQVLPSTDQIYRMPIRAWWTVRKVVDDLKAGKDSDIRTLVLDHVTQMYHLNLSSLDMGKDNRLNYQKANVDLVNLTNDLLDMAEGPRRLNVIFVFQESQETRTKIEGTGQPTEIQRLELSLSNKIQQEFPGMVPFQGHLRIGMSAPPEPRVLDFRASPFTQAKWQTKRDPRFDRIPHEIWNPSLGHLIDVIQGGKNFDVQRFQRPQAQFQKAQQ